MKKYLALLLAFVMVFALAVPAFAAEEAATETAAEASGEITIFYTNDTHTYIDNTRKVTDADGNETKVDGIRFSTVGALKDSVPGALLVDAGDHIQGTAYGSMDKGETIIKLMNAAGYDLATLGNHEFDYGMEGMFHAVELADFPYISCNFFEINPKTGAAVADALPGVWTFEVNGKTIAFIGITTPESFTKSTPAYFQNDKGQYIYDIPGGEDGSDLYTCVQAAIDGMKEEADYIIALGHLGDDPASDPWNSEDVIANTTGLDAFIDGHSHSTVEHKEVADKDGNTVILTQTGEYLKAVGKMTITADGTINTELLSPEDLADLTPKAEVETIEDQWIADLDEKLGQVIGSIDDTLDNYDAEGNRLVRKQETNTGDFCADALYYLFDNMGLDVDFAIMNGGGVRNKAITGDITYKTCKEIHTFGNVACLQTITGQQMLDALEWGAKDANGAGTMECGGFLQVSGLKYTIDTTILSTVQKDEKGVWIGGPTGEYRVKDVMVLNKETGEYEPIDLEAKYNLAGYNYTLRDLGDGFAMFDGAVNVLDYVMEDYQVLANYVQSFENGKVTGYAEPQGRITILKDILADYADLDTSAWYADAVRQVVTEGLMKGTNNGFEPTGTVTRATVYQVLYNLEGKPEVNNKMATFPDARGTWYETAARWAEEIGLTTGDGTGNFAGDRVATRAEIVTILCRYAEKSVGASVKSDTNILSYADAETIGEWAVSAFQWACGKEIIKGSNNYLMPGASATRVELAQMMYNFLNADIAADIVSPEGETMSGVKAKEVSKYGNVTTDLTIADFTAAGYEVGDILSVRLSNQTEALSIPYGTGYSNVDQGSNVALADGEYLAIAINRGDFATTYGIATKGEDNAWTFADVTISISMGEKGGYAEELMMRDVDSKRTNNREDYASDAVFANFRNITVGDIAEGRIYRTSSPVNPELGRNTYADKLIQEAGVKYVVNLADCRNSVKEYEGYADTYYATLTEDTVHLNMTVDMYSEESLGDLKTGLVFLSEKEGPFAFHCTEGKDRAGYFAMLVEALMGATTEEIVNDYMLSFENYYFVEKGSEQWNKIAESNIKKDLCKLAGVTADELDSVDWAKAAETYVTETIGLTSEQVSALRANLSTPVAN